MNAMMTADTIHASAHYLDTVPAHSDPIYESTPAYIDATVSLRSANRLPNITRLGVLGLTAVWSNIVGEQVAIENESDLLALSIIGELL